MKLAVIGSRSFSDKQLLFSILSGINNIELIISGGAKGADQMAEEFAKQHNIDTLIFKPDYNQFGRGAPLIRNKHIVNSSELIVAFWDGKSRGTKNALEHTQKSGKKIEIHNF